jgi:hypothetical protein
MPLWPLVGVIAVGALLAARPARAVIVYDSPGKLTTLPVLSGSVRPGWQYIGNYNGFGGVPIGPRAWVTATHISAASMNFWYQNGGGTNAWINYQGTRVAVTGDLSIAVLNEDQPDFTLWAPVWSGTSNITADLPVYMYGFGTLRGSARTGGWNWGGYEFALSYGTNNIVSGTFSAAGNVQFRMPFNEPTVGNGLPGTEGIFSTGDSGSGLFAYNTANARWELIGINSRVETVAATSGGALIGAALYDARGYYTGENRTILIGGPTPVPLSSYSIALPYYADLLAPYVPVPEPSSVVLAVAGLGAAGFRALRRRTSRS